MCCTSDGRISGRWTLGLRARGGVRHVSTNSSLSTVRGNSCPTNRRSVDPSSIPRPSHRPHGNLGETENLHISFNRGSIGFFFVRTCMCDQSLHFGRRHVRPSISATLPNYRGRSVMLSVCPCFYASPKLNASNKYGCMQLFAIAYCVLLTWKTNSNELVGIATCCVSAILPETAIQTLADVIVGPFFFDGKMATRYGSSESRRQNKHVNGRQRKSNSTDTHWWSGRCLWSKNNRPCSASTNGIKIALFRPRSARMPTVCTTCAAAPCPKEVFGNALTIISSPMSIVPKLLRSLYES